MIQKLKDELVKTGVVLDIHLDDFTKWLIEYAKRNQKDGMYFMDGNDFMKAYGDFKVDLALDEKLKSFKYKVLNEVEVEVYNKLQEKECKPFEKVLFDKELYKKIRRNLETNN